MDLEAEFEAAQFRVGPRHVAWLKRQGVTPLGMVFNDGGFAFGVCEIEIQSDDSWMPMPGGREAMIVPDDNQHGVQDLIAFFPKVPSAMFRRANALRYAGEESLEWAKTEGAPLYLRENVLEWMRWGFTGLVVLDWTPQWALASDFQNVPEVRADNAALGAKLRAALMRPFAVPSILVPD